MIIVRLMGGLGNQMFQIAFARALSLELDEQIYLDCNVYKKYKIREFSLNNLEIADCLVDYNQSSCSVFYKKYIRLSQKIYHVYQKIVKEISKSDKIGYLSYNILSKIGLLYNFDRYFYNVPLNFNKRKCLYGYFQSERYFLNYKNEICEELKVKTQLTSREKHVLERIRQCHAVAISIRMGDDYLQSKELDVCKLEYYYKAMDYLYSRNSKIVFFIFSDCIDRVKNNFKFKYPVEYIEGFKDYESLRLMYNCQDFIISNSSFSWWGAYLSDYEDKTVIAPSRWYNNSKYFPAIYNENMILLDADSGSYCGKFKDLNRNI